MALISRSIDCNLYHLCIQHCPLRSVGRRSIEETHIGVSLTMHAPMRLETVF